MQKLKRDIERYYGFCGTNPPISSIQVLRACLNPRLLPVVILRMAGACEGKKCKVLGKIFSIINFLFFGLEVSSKVKIGEGLFLPHTVGTVIGAARIGINCTIMQGVTLGSAEPDLHFDESKRPVIGDNVLIGSGAKIIGSVFVGNNVKIGANAVVVKDIPDNSVAVGVPAVVVIPIGEARSEWRE